MRYPKTIFILFYTFIFIAYNYAYASSCANCCQAMGGIRYCDSSAGRYVCQNGEYSSCYCTRHAIMDLQKLAGCCLWQGGVMLVDPQGVVICNNGASSELCSNNNYTHAATMCP